jgi:hypothetical protein
MRWSAIPVGLDITYCMEPRHYCCMIELTVESDLNCSLRVYYSCLVCLATAGYRRQFEKLIQSFLFLFSHLSFPVA